MAYDEDLAERIRGLLTGEPGITEQRMFGGLAFLVAGNMAVAASGEGGLMVRVEPAAGEVLLAAPHVRPFRMGGREIRGWLRVDVDGLEAPEELDGWVGRGVAHARSLAPRR